MFPDFPRPNGLCTKAPVSKVSIASHTYVHGLSAFSLAASAVSRCLCVRVTVHFCTSMYASCSLKQGGTTKDLLLGKDLSKQPILGDSQTTWPRDTNNGQCFTPHCTSCERRSTPPLRAHASHMTCLQDPRCASPSSATPHVQHQGLRLSADAKARRKARSRIPYKDG
jgi:hypothetical protein